MYEQFKNQFALTLSATYSTDDIEVILRKLDMVSYNYEISKKETSVAVYNSEMPEMVKTYLVCKKVEGLSEQTLYNYGNALRKFFLPCSFACFDVTKSLNQNVTITKHIGHNANLFCISDWVVKWICKFV